MTGPSAGPEIRLDYDEAFAMLQKAEAVIDYFQSMGLDSTYLVGTRPAADDPASKAYNTVLTWNGQSGAFGHGVDHIALERMYIHSLADRLKQAMGMTSESDSQRGQDLNNSAGNTDGGFL